MTVWKIHACGLVLCALAQSCAPVSASESLIELTTGGLDIAKASGSAPVVLESENVAVSLARVIFRYRISTPGPAPVRIELNFRYPDLDFSDPDATYAIPGSDPINFLDAKLKIAGAPAAMTLSQTASLDGKNVTATLAKARLPLVPVGDFGSRLAAAPQALQKSLQADGLIKEVGTSVEGAPLLFPTWTVKTEGAFRMTLQPAKPVDVEIAYRPSIGVRQDSLLRKALRDNKELAADAAAQISTFCSEPAVLKGIDAMAGAAEANVAQLRERRIRILMRDPAAAPVPAVAYRLSVDKGKASRIVSFCAQNLNKTSPTTFVAKMSNFVPKPEFYLLIIEGRTSPSVRRAPRRAPLNAAPPFVGRDATDR
ncbi:DUF4424 domain-containing protein [Rhodoblastus acidophilus]|uniref:DUF4424 domain-containing protein n=1 Tax=Candidatus Rhodoblastus alkanivorans TaxID=2954117 RepID=A0ABS9Z7G9_9HYPH|nr:DUF4424 family protein [Candidatus Rhodoblastus alkanivorans]MCI4678288.1 DUF4424 domain-containing protein [Candidatus Rhodoblastus alkanivorans]MCI4683546.1 DUF4424 domain-containing protein [Candidatus Rhodoblastus alkanivorans]MDI4640861.1 DUF4424 domain-containing protein [Rhodoblastus acidophilus]